MSKKTARYRIDPRDLPPLTRAQKAELAALEAAPDSDIDYSEIPELTEKFWQNAVRNPYYRPIKKQLTLRLDADVVAWFKRRAAGRGYQTGINRALREHIERHGKKTGQ
jgi:uncharacterized protein (DUF4415 family)